MKEDVGQHLFLGPVHKVGRTFALARHAHIQWSVAQEREPPLTPIQLSAERIRRKFRDLSEDEAASLDQLVGVIVRQTGDIGMFVLVGDSASSAGVRRVEALTGKEAFAYLERDAGRVAEATYSR